MEENDYETFLLEEFKKLNESKMIKKLDRIMANIFKLYGIVVTKYMTFIIKKRLKKIKGIMEK